MTQPQRVESAMQTNLIDISEDKIFESMPEVLSTLLRDHTLSGTDPQDFRHIKWATHDYELLEKGRICKTLCLTPNRKESI